MRIVYIILLLVILVLTIMFASLNSTSAPVNYLIGKADVPLILLMFVNLLLGVALGWLFMVWKVIKLKTTVLSLNSKLKRVEDNLSKAKDLDLKEV